MSLFPYIIDKSKITLKIPERHNSYFILLLFIEREKYIIFIILIFTTPIFFLSFPSGPNQTDLSYFLNNSLKNYKY